MKGIITSITPLRISFAGGGTDIENFYKLDGGNIVSTAINKYIYVSVKKHSNIFKERYRLNYSKTELKQHTAEIENDIIRECIYMTQVDDPLYISTVADMPSATGLGSSSAFAVGLLNALYTYKGQRVSAGRLAEEACEIEIKRLRQPIGKQDQYAAAFGGLNHYNITKCGRVKVDHIYTSEENMQELMSNIFLVYTGMTRSATNILKKQEKNKEINISILREISKDAKEMKNELLNEHIRMENIAKLLKRNWERKQKLCDAITNNGIDQLYSRCIKEGSLGGKLLGAGGGGFLLMIGDEQCKNSMIREVGIENVIDIGYETQGSRILG